MAPRLVGPGARTPEWWWDGWWLAEKRRSADGPLFPQSPLLSAPTPTHTPTHLQVLVHKEGLGHRGGVCQPGGLNQDGVKPGGSGGIQPREWQTAGVSEAGAVATCVMRTALAASRPAPRHPARTPSPAAALHYDPPTLHLFLRFSSLCRMRIRSPRTGGGFGLPGDAGGGGGVFRRDGWRRKV